MLVQMFSNHYYKNSPSLFIYLFIYFFIFLFFYFFIFIFIFILFFFCRPTLCLKQAPQSLSWTSYSKYE